MLILSKFFIVKRKEIVCLISTKNISNIFIMIRIIIIVFIDHSIVILIVQIILSWSILVVINLVEWWRGTRRIPQRIWSQWWWWCIGLMLMIHQWMIFIVIFIVFFASICPSTSTHYSFDVLNFLFFLFGFDLIWFWWIFSILSCTSHI